MTLANGALRFFRVISYRPIARDVAWGCSLARVGIICWSCQRVQGGGGLCSTPRGDFLDHAQEAAPRGMLPAVPPARKRPGLGAAASLPQGKRQSGFPRRPVQTPEAEPQARNLARPEVRLQGINPGELALPQALLAIRGTRTKSPASCSPSPARHASERSRSLSARCLGPAPGVPLN